MKLPLMGICWFHTVELDFPNNPNYGYPLDPTSKLKKKKGHIDGKDSYKSVTLWHDHVYLWIVYIQFCCPKFNMKQMEEIISRGVHGSQHFLCGTCPIALFALFFPQVFCFKCFSSVSFRCVLLWCSPLSPQHSCTHSSFQITRFSFRPSCAQTHCQPCMVSML